MATLEEVREAIGRLGVMLDGAHPDFRRKIPDRSVSVWIKDLDVASEMVNFTKTQILQQAGTAILAQANQAPQGILSLLK